MVLVSALPDHDHSLHLSGVWNASQPDAGGEVTITQNIRLTRVRTVRGPKGEANAVTEYATVPIEVFINDYALAQHLGHKAMQSTSRRATLLHGNIRAQAPRNIEWRLDQ